MRVYGCLWIVVLGLAPSVAAQPPAAGAEQPPGVAMEVDLQPSGVRAALRGLAVVDSQTAWASGAEGRVLRTVDGGRSWESVGPPQTAELQFRDVHAWSPLAAVVLSSGSPTRFYRTEDGGRSWRLTLEDVRPQPFYDAMDFWDQRRGIAFSDPLDGRLLLSVTDDGGRSWRETPLPQRPATDQFEAGFAASGTCLVCGPSGRVWIGLGGAAAAGEAETARVIYSIDYGRSWRTGRTPLKRSASAGVFGLLMWDAEHGVAVGGDYQAPDATAHNVARTEDGGATWRPIAGSPPSGFRSAVAAARFRDGRVLVTVGDNGADLSLDDGESWRRVAGPGFHAVQFAPGQASGWAVGADGRIGRLTLRDIP